MNTRRMRNRPGSIFEAVVTDGHGRLTLTFFGRGQPALDARTGSSPACAACSPARCPAYRGKRQLAHPDYELLGAGVAGARAAEYAAELIPIYPATARLASWKIADAVRVVLDVLDVPEDPLPAAIRARHGLRGLRRRAARHPPAGRRGGRAGGTAAAEMGRGVRASGDAGPAAAGRGRLLGHPAAGGGGRAAGGVRRGAAVRADRGPAAGRGADRRRAGRRPPDEPAAAGRGRLGQDGDRDPGHAPGRRRGRPGGAAGPDRGAGPAALPVDHQHAGAAGPGGHARRGRAGDQGRAADRVAGRGQPPPGAAGGGRRARPGS